MILCLFLLKLYQNVTDGRRDIQRDEHTGSYLLPSTMLISVDVW